MSNEGDEEESSPKCEHKSQAITGNYGANGWECMECHTLVAISWETIEALISFCTKKIQGCEDERCLREPHLMAREVLKLLDRAAKGEKDG